MGRRRALVVANDAYADPGLRQLKSPSRDAEELAQILSDPAIGAFEVTVVENAGVQVLRETVESFFAGAERDDELLVHFSCHGLKDDANDLYLAATDTRPSLIASTGLPADFVARRMRATRARSVALFLDCCYGGAFERGLLARAGTEVPVLDAFDQQQLASGAGRVVITASSAVEYAFESGDLTDSGVTPSVFTGALVEGISTGEADSDGDGRISVGELFAYAESEVRRVTPNQTPHMWSFGTHGDIVVARSPLREVKPAALPPYVVAALGGDKIHQLGAVQVLRSLLRDADPSVVLAARRALEGLAEDDSRSLSSAATEALSTDRFALEPASLDFAEVRALLPAETRSATLVGSALIAAARVTAHPPWLVVRHVGDRLDVSLRPQQPGDYAGEVVVSGPSGTLRLPVTASVVPAPSPASPPQPPPTPEEGPTVAADEHAPAFTRSEATAPPGRRGAGVARWLSWVRWLWVAAAAAYLLVLFLPVADGTLVISTVSSASEAFAGVVMFGLASALLVLAAARFRPAAGRWGLPAAIPGSLLILAVFLLAATSASDSGVAVVTATLVASILAVAATLAAVLGRRQDHARVAPLGPGATQN